MVLFFAFPSYALEGGDTAPGTACSIEEATRMTANPSGTGGYILTCEGGVWVATISGDTPTRNKQVATKAYVDSNSGISIQNPDDCDEGDSPVYVAATGDWWCPCSVAGEVCLDGSVFAGEINGAPLYVTDANQSTNIQWKTSTGTDDINPDSNTDGQANHDNRSGTLSDFPAFELCENLDRHGHTDWYLPAQDELNLVFTNRAVIGGFTTMGYFSSTEVTTTYARDQNFSNGTLRLSNKAFYGDVRCVRKD